MRLRTWILLPVEAGVVPLLKRGLAGVRTVEWKVERVRRGSLGAASEPTLDEFYVDWVLSDYKLRADLVSSAFSAELSPGVARFGAISLPVVWKADSARVRPVLPTLTF